MKWSRVRRMSGNMVVAACVAGAVLVGVDAGQAGAAGRDRYGLNVETGNVVAYRYTFSGSSWTQRLGSFDAFMDALRTQKPNVYAALAKATGYNGVRGNLDQLDGDKDGYVSQSELLAVLGDALSSHDVERLLREYGGGEGGSSGAGAVAGESGSGGGYTDGQSF